MFETGKIEHLLAAIDNIVNGEVNLPPGEHTKLFERIREVGKGYTVIGTQYTYNDRNQLTHRENLIRYEEYDYAYDEAGNLLTDGRSQYEWNARGHLTKVTFPDGFGEKYDYDMQGRRISKIRFNHQGETQQTTNYHYKGDTWMLTEEVVIEDADSEDGEASKSYTYDTNDRPLSITFKGETFWYVYNGHGDVMALTDKDGNVAARYEYDAWGLVTRMYNRYGERVREGIGWIGDLGSGNGSPGSLQGPEDDTGNIVPDYHPGIGNSDEHGNGNGNGKSKGKVEIQSLLVDAVTDSELATDTADGSTDATLLDSMVTEETEPTEDITTDLVKENPIRYAGYHWDRKTQTYYLQARDYDPRPARFISEDTYEGEIDSPLSLNLYTYVSNNPLKYVDPSGHRQCEGAIRCDIMSGKSVADTSNWIKVTDSLYRIVDVYTQGTLSDYVNISKKKPYSVKHFLTAGLLVVSIVPVTKAEGTIYNSGYSLIQKGGKWFKVKFTKKVSGNTYDGVRIINKKYAGQVYKFEGDLATKYSNGVKFNNDGFPDFSPYSKAKVTLDGLKGNATDFTAANKAVGLKSTPQGYTWHHVEDGRTLMLVPTELHQAVRHTGGAALIKKGLAP